MEQTSLEQMAAVLRAAGLPVHTEIPALDLRENIVVHREDGSVLLGRLTSNGDGSVDVGWEAVASPARLDEQRRREGEGPSEVRGSISHAR